MSGPLTLWEPFTADLAELRTRMDRMLDDWVDGRERVRTPAVDIVRGDHTMVVRADMPGLKPEEVKIEVQDDILTVSGEHEERDEEKTADYVRRERRYGSFCRSMPLPDGVDAEKITATTHDGILEVTIPLPVEAEKKTISITPTAV